MKNKKYERPVVVPLDETAGGASCGDGAAPGGSDQCRGGLAAGANCGTGTDAVSTCMQGNQAKRDRCHQGSEAY
jgi:hypothetical protein